MLADLGHPPTEQIARSLRVSIRTVYRWKARDCAPKAVMLAIFWSTRWGRSCVETAAMNEASMYAGLADAYKRENERLKRELARVLSIGDFGSANAPTTRDLALHLTPVRSGQKA